MKFKNKDGRQCDVCGKLAVDNSGETLNQIGWIQVQKLLADSTTEYDICSVACYVQLQTRLGN